MIFLIIRAIGWYLYRIILLNLIPFTVVIMLAAVRNLFEQSEIFRIKIPFQVYFICLFLVNFIYLTGNSFEIIYLKLWNKPIDYRKFEKNFFKVGIAMIVIINIAASVLYFIR